MAIAVAGVIACDESSGRTIERANPEVSDSAGVQIVVVSYVAPPKNRVKVGLKPFLDIGGLSNDGVGELDLRTPWLNGVRLANGTVVVNESTSLEFFSARGELTKSVGRAGGGPGEFSQIREVCPMSGDSLLVIDFPSGKRTVVDPQGHTARAMETAGSIPVGACDEAGNVLVRASGSSQAIADGNLIGRAKYRLLSPRGIWLDQFLDLPVSLSGGPLSFEPSFGFAESKVVVADPAKNEIRIFDRFGALVRIVRFATAPRVVSDADWDSIMLWAYPAKLNSPELRRKLIERSRALRPTRFPSFARVWVDAEARAWVQDFFAPSKFLVLRLSGEVLGEVHLPSGRATRIESDYVVMKDFDSDGAAHLRFYRVQ